MNTFALLRLASLGMATLLSTMSLWAEGPRINREFPVRDKSSLSPPSVQGPLHECAHAVFVYGFLPTPRSPFLKWSRVTLRASDFRPCLEPTVPDSQRRQHQQVEHR